MKKAFNLMIATLMIFIIGCDFNLTSPSEQISDSKIIEMIKNSEKIEISFNELPSQSRSTVQSEYIDYESLKNWIASDIGYLAELSGRGHRLGEYREVYFNIDGRKLEYNNNEDEERPGGDGFSGDSNDRERPEGDDEDACGEIILPITYIMPNGSVITIEDDSGYGLLREWAENNPESGSEPSLQYPFNVLFVVEDQEVTVTVNSNEEYRDYQIEYCSSDRD